MSNGLESSNDGRTAFKSLIVQESNEDKVPITYTCRYDDVNQNLPRKSAQVTVHYDLAYPCTMDISDAKKYVAQQLLQNSALAWAILPAAETCSRPVIFNNVWMFGVSSEPKDEIVPDIGCQALVPGPSECCNVIKMNMRFLATGNYDDDMLDDALVRYLRAELSTPELTWELPIQTFPVEHFDDLPNNMGHDTLTASTSTQSDSSQKLLPSFWALLIAALAVFVFGVMLVIVRRYRRRRLSWFQKHENVGEDEEFHTVTVVTESEDHRVVEQATSADTPKYAFDLGESFRNSVMKAVAPTILPVVAAYPPEDSSMDDSWAQTDGTVGSLEERLEEITAEI